MTGLSSFCAATSSSSPDDESSNRAFFELFFERFLFDFSVTDAFRSFPLRHSSSLVSSLESSKTFRRSLVFVGVSFVPEMCRSFLLLLLLDFDDTFGVELLTFSADGVSAPFEESFRFFFSISSS